MFLFASRSILTCLPSRYGLLSFPLFPSFFKFFSATCHDYRAMNRHSFARCVDPFHSIATDSELDSLRNVKPRAKFLSFDYRVFERCDNCLSMWMETPGATEWHLSLSNTSRIIESRRGVANSTHELVDHPVTGREREKRSRTHRSRLSSPKEAPSPFHLALSADSGINTISKREIISLFFFFFFTVISFRWD